MMIDLKYLFDKYRIDCKGVLHCGASTGQEAKVYAELGVPEVVWIEAIPSVFEQLEKNIATYRNQAAIQACLSDKDGDDVLFNVSNNEAQSSSFLELGVHAKIHPEVHYIDLIPMKTRRLDSIFKLYGWEEINFGNFDLQGAELFALKGLGQVISQFDYLYLEVNKRETYKGCALIGDIDAYLWGHEFTRVEVGQWVADTWTDALYVKNNLLK